tara:strand:- start:1038 stop:1490 length:453 start_codon:yes stop_codon:yes gene_type:complete
MEIKIISLGKFKSSNSLREIFLGYKKRIDINLKLVEAKTYNFEKKKKLLYERNEIAKHLSKNDCIVTLDKSGKDLSSQKFFEFLSTKMNVGVKRICFLIGSEEGIDDYFKNNQYVFSFGNKTWPHLLIRIMLIEQIYRSSQIMKGTSYHK